ncbi:MAG: diguanylate cyclase [Desulfobulbus sp.]
MYNEISDIVLKSLQKNLKDVGNFGSLLFDKDSREAIKRIKFRAIKESVIDKDFVKSLHVGETYKTISEDKVNDIQSSEDFQKILLRLRIIGHATYQYSDNRIIEPLSDNYNFDLDLIGFEGFLGGGIGAYLAIDLMDMLPDVYGMYIASACPETTKSGYPGNPVGNLFHSFVSFTELNKKSYTFDSVIKDEFYESLSGSVPIYDENHNILAILGVDYSVGPQLGRLYRAKNVFIIIILIDIIFSIFISYIISTFLSYPLKILHKSAVCISNNDYTCKVDIKSKDEFGFLGKIFNEMIDSIQNNFTELERINKNLENIVKERTEKLVEKNKKLELLSITDMLTGLYNRRYIEIRVSSCIENFNRYGTLFSTIMIDIDKFKSVNDNFGHDIGDHVLECISIIIKNNIRNVDCAGRWGGEEFIIICQEDINGAISISEKIRNKIMTAKFDGVGCVTASFGCSQYIAKENFDLLLKRADSALFMAKNNGRNRVEFNC